MRALWPYLHLLFLRPALPIVAPPCSAQGTGNVTKLYGKFTTDADIARFC